MTGFLARPLDWVAFGPPRPHFAGDSSRRGTQLPYPTAFQGMIRTALLVAAGDDFSDGSGAAQARRDSLVGGPSRLPNGWQIRGPYFTQIQDTDLGPVAFPWVRAPRFLVGLPRKPLVAHPCPPDGNLAATGRDNVERQRALNDLSPDAEPFLLGAPTSEYSKPLGGWLSPGGLLWALSGERSLSAWSPSNHSSDLPPFVSRQLLPGIRINHEKGTAEDGQLFAAEVLRFERSSGIAGWLEAQLPEAIPEDALTRSAIAAYGWRSRPVVLDALPSLDTDFQYISEGKHLPATVTESDRFFLVALTPVPHAAGESSAIAAAATTMPGWPSEVTLHVLTALRGRPCVLGGLEVASKRARPNRAYWEAGSSWLVRFSGGGPGSQGAAARARAVRALNDSHCLGGEEASFGYGHIVVGLGPRSRSGNIDAVDDREVGEK